MNALTAMQLKSGGIGRITNDYFISIFSHFVRVKEF